jgi:PAS domain S-box-containing protein
MLTKEGTYKWILDSARGVAWDSAGNPTRMCGTHADIDDREQAEEQLSESRRQTEMAILGADLGTWEARYDRRTISYNLRIAELLGYSLEELTSKFGTHQTCELLFHPSERELFLDAWSVHEAGTEDLVQIEHRFKHKSGHYIWVLNRGQILERDDDGKPLRASGTYLDITERKQAEQALQSSEQRMNLALQSAGVGIWEWDGRSNEFVLTEDIVGIPGHSDWGHGPRPVSWMVHAIHPDDLKGKGEAWMAHLKGETESYEHECRVRNSDGEWVWILDRGRVTERDAEGRALRAIGTNMNITWRKEAELELAESQHQMELALRGANLATWDLKLPSYEVVYNRRFGEMLGYVEEEVRDRFGSLGNWLKLVHPDDQESLGDIWNRHLNEEDDFFQREHRMQHKSGRWVWLLNKGRVFERDHTGKPLRACGTYLDVTKRKEAEEELRASQMELQLLYENSLFGMALCEMDGTIVQANQAYLDIIGYSKEDVHDLTYWEVTPEEYGDQEAVQLKSLKEIGRYGPYEKEYIHKDGHRVPVLLNGTLVTGVDGVDRIWSIVENITQSKKAEEDRSTLELQLRQSQKMEAVGQLAGGIAHDFNNILQAILGYGEIAYDKAGDNSSLKRYLNEILRASDRAKNLVRQLLAFSRRQVLDMRNVDLNHVVLDLVEMIRQLIGPHITLKTDLAEELGTVRADAGQLEQILVNLCVNSRDAMTEGGTIVIKTENFNIDQEFVVTHPWATPGEYVRVTVSDTGWGMDEDTLTQIFEPFFTTKGLNKGTGLGLSTVYGLVKQSIWA